MKPHRLTKLALAFGFLLLFTALVATHAAAAPAPTDQPRIDLAASTMADTPTSPQIQIPAHLLDSAANTQVAIAISADTWNTAPEIRITISLSSIKAGTKAPTKLASQSSGLSTTSRTPGRTAMTSPPLAPTSGGSGYSVVGPPSVSVKTIKIVLKLYHSPSVGHAQAFYDQGVKYGIDPAFMLAFYIKESSAGTAGAAIVTHNVGNIICTPDWVKAGGLCSGRWRVYPSDIAGAEDWYQHIAGPGYVEQGLRTVAQIAPKYAPLGDCNPNHTQCNNPQEYINTIERLVDWFRTIERGR